MDLYPKILKDTLEDAISVIKCMIKYREDDVSQFNQNVALNSYQSGFRRQTVSMAANYAVGQDDLAVDATGGGAGITLTLSASPFDGQTHEFFKSDAGAGAITISGNGKNLNGSATASIAAQYGWMRVIYIGDAGEWRKQT